MAIIIIIIIIIFAIIYHQQSAQAKTQVHRIFDNREKQRYLDKDR